MSIKCIDEISYFHLRFLLADDRPSSASEAHEFTCSAMIDIRFEL